MSDDNHFTSSFDPKKILELFQIDEDIIEKLDIYHASDGVHIAVTLKKAVHNCPICGCETARTKAYVDKKIKHAVLTNNECFINYRARRFICPACGKTFLEKNPFVLENMKISVATVYNVLGDLKNSHDTFTSVGDRYGISPTTAIKIFDEHVHISRRKLPEVLCVDEVYAMPNDESKYVCVLLDFKTQKVVDILPSRRKSDLINYFSLIPKKERENVKYVSFDLWKTYRDVAGIMFPGSLTSCDKFHVIQEMSRQFKNVRIRIMKQYAQTRNYYRYEKSYRPLAPKEREKFREACDNYYVLKKFNWLLFSSDERINDPNEKKRFNKVLCRYMNYYDLYDYLIHINSELEIAAYLKDDLQRFYKNCQFENAGDQLNSIIKDFRTCGIPELVHFAGTLAEWKHEIVNSFIIVDKDKKRRINNGVIENKNKIIKNLKHNANGFKNFNRFRNRAMYCINDDATFYMLPIKKGDENNHEE